MNRHFKTAILVVWSLALAVGVYFWHQHQIDNIAGSPSPDLAKPIVFGK